MQAQDSSDPTGVADLTPRQHGTQNTLVRARSRKANAAVQMKLAGATWAEIAEALGYPTARTAMVATEKALEKLLANPEDRVAMRVMAGARLERLLRSVWSKAINPDSPDHLVAVSKARDIIDRHAKLYGLDAPTEIIVHNPTTQELEAWVARVVTGSGEPVQEFDIIEGTVMEDAVPPG